MKRFKVTSVILAVTMLASMFMPSVEVLADEASVPTETQSSEPADKKESDETKKPEVKETTKPKETEVPIESKPVEDKETSKETVESTENEASKETESPKETAKPAAEEPKVSYPQKTNLPKVTESSKETEVPAETVEQSKDKKSNKNSTSIASGQCGENISWSLDSQGTLSISGSGFMYDYVYGSSFAPWYQYKSSIEKVIISEEVRYIGNEAFTDCTNLKSVIIPDCVYSFGNSAFFGCSQLENITLPKDLNSISRYAFAQCTSLKEIIIPEGVTKIENLAFSECSSLKTVVLPVSLTTIEDGVFERCTSLSDVYYGDSVREWDKVKKGENSTLINANFHFAFYWIGVKDCVNGIARSSKSKAKVGEEITITYTPDEGYELGSIEVNGNPINGNKFFLGEEDAIVTVIFKKTGIQEHSISVNGAVNGSVKLSKDKAYAGDEITITATPNEGYVLLEIQVYGKPITGNSFIMEDCETVVTVTFITEVKIVIDKDSFPDQAFREMIKKYCDNGDGVLTSSEIEKITFLPHDDGIKSFKGIEFFPELTSFSCDYCDITDIDISANQKIKQLSCCTVGLKSVDISKNTKLAYAFTNNLFNKYRYGSLVYYIAYINEEKIAIVTDNTIVLICNGQRYDPMQDPSLDPCAEIDPNLDPDIKATKESSFWKSMSSDYFYKRMPKNWQKYYNRLDNICMAKLISEEDLPDSLQADYSDLGLSYADASDVANIFVYNNPQYFFIEHLATSTSTSKIIIPTHEDFRSVKDRAEAKDKLKAEIKDYINAASIYSLPEQKEHAIVELMCKKLSYKSSWHDQSMYSALFHQTVCAGYTKIFTALMNACGVECIAITGEDECGKEKNCHAWNMINLHGFWYYVDVTWMDSSSGRIKYNNYNKRTSSGIADAKFTPLPIVRYSNIDYEYSSRYFTYNNITYFIFNDTENPGYQVLPVSGLTASLPETVEHNGRTYSVIAKIADDAEYKVSVCNTENGTVSVSTNKAHVGDTVTVTATPDEGYELDRIKVYGEYLKGSSFVMSWGNASVEVTFRKKGSILYHDYELSVISPINGSVDLSKKSAQEGDVITVTAKPDKGYFLLAIVVNGNDLDGTSFVMPARDVTVEVFFAEQSDNTLAVTGGNTVKVKYKKLKKKKQTVACGKMMTVRGAQGKVTYKILKVNKKKSSFKINAATGAVTLKKKLKKGTYKLTVSVTAAGNDEYKSASKIVSFKIKVK